MLPNLPEILMDMKNGAWSQQNQHLRSKTIDKTLCWGDVPLFRVIFTYSNGPVLWSYVTDMVWILQLRTGDWTQCIVISFSCLAHAVRQWWWGKRTPFVHVSYLIGKCGGWIGGDGRCSRQQIVDYLQCRIQMYIQCDLVIICDEAYYIL